MALMVGHQKEGSNPTTFSSQCSLFPWKIPTTQYGENVSFPTGKHTSKQGIKCQSSILEAILDLDKWLFWTTLPLKGSMPSSSSSEGCEDSLYLGALPSHRSVNLLVLLRPPIVLPWGWDTQGSGRARFAPSWVLEPSVRCLTPTSGSFWT